MAVNIDFRARLKPKRKIRFNESLSPFPSGIFKGFFTGLSVIVSEKDAISEIYRNGYYGKGVSRGAPESQVETLVLQMEEAFFLAYFLRVLQIKTLRGKLFDHQQLLNAGLELNPRYIDTLAAYLYLKSKNWVVKSGLKYGGDYTIYKNGPEVFHASFVVFVLQSNETQLWKHKNIKGVYRVTENSNKDILLLEIVKPEGYAIINLDSFKQITVAEIIIRRMKMSLLIQSPNANN